MRGTRIKVLCCGFLVFIVLDDLVQDSWVRVESHTQFVTPSLTPFTNKNPAFRVFATDDRYALVRVDTYFLDLAEANRQGKAAWQLEYSLPAAYARFGMRDLAPDSFDAVARQLRSNASLWDAWNTYHTCSTRGQSACSSDECKKVQTCTLLSPTLLDWNRCMIAP